MPACEHFGLGLLPYFPLANGLLTGKVPARAASPTGTRLAGQSDYVTDGAPGHGRGGCSRWAPSTAGRCSRSPSAACAASPPVASVIAGATRPEQVQANVAAGDWLPTDDELAEIRALTDPRP